MAELLAVLMSGAFVIACLLIVLGIIGATVFVVEYILMRSRR